MGLGLGFTALTLWSFYHDFVILYKAKDVASIEDVALYMGKPLLVLTLISIGLNMIPVFFKTKK